MTRFILLLDWCVNEILQAGLFIKQAFVVGPLLVCIDVVVVVIIVVVVVAIVVVLSMATRSSTLLLGCR